MGCGKRPWQGIFSPNVQYALERKTRLERLTARRPCNGLGPAAGGRRATGSRARPSTIALQIGAAERIILANQKSSPESCRHGDADAGRWPENIWLVRVAHILVQRPSLQRSQLPAPRCKPRPHEHRPLVLHSLPRRTYRGHGSSRERRLLEFCNFVARSFEGIMIHCNRSAAVPYPGLGGDLSR